MKKRLCRGLSGKSEQVCRKYGTFFVFCFFLLSGACHVKASEVTNALPERRTIETITVSAVVPLTDEFVFLMRKNSEVVFEKKSFILGEEGEVRISIRGGKGEPLQNHRVTGRVFDVRQKEIISFSGKTDSAGKVIFHVKFTEQFLGENTLRVADMTYGKALFLMEHPSFIVYETRSAKEEAKKDGERVAVSQGTGAETFFNDLFQPVGDFSERSATIAVYRPVETFSRAGPT